jgi:hypothetical protein
VEVGRDLNSSHGSYAFDKRIIVNTNCIEPLAPLPYWLYAWFQPLLEPKPQNMHRVNLTPGTRDEAKVYREDSAAREQPNNDTEAILNRLVGSLLNAPHHEWEGATATRRSSKERSREFCPSSHPTQSYRENERPHWALKEEDN